MNDLLKQLKSDKKLEAQYLDEVVATPKRFVKCDIPAFNLMLSGKYHGGFYAGITTVAAPSRHFKTMIMLYAMSKFLQEDEKNVAIFFDSENGASADAFDFYGIDRSRVINLSIMNIEELSFKMMNVLDKQLNESHTGKVFIGIDSIGNLASKKEVDNAIEENAAKDMTRAQVLKSFFRIVTPYVTKYKIPFWSIGHVYSELGVYPKTVMSGGQGPLLSSDTVLFITKSTNKDGKVIEGFNFNMSAHKSRFIREGSRIPLTVTFENGIDRASGLLEMGLALGCIEKRGNRYAPVFIDEDGVVDLQEDLLQYKKNIDYSWFEQWQDDPRSEFIKKSEAHFKLNSVAPKEIDEISELIEE